MAELQGRVRLACGSRSPPGSARPPLGSLGAARPLLGRGKSCTWRWPGGGPAKGDCLLSTRISSVSASVSVSVCVRARVCVHVRARSLLGPLWFRLFSRSSRGPRWKQTSLDSPHKPLKCQKNSTAPSASCNQPQWARVQTRNLKDGMTVGGPES